MAPEKVSARVILKQAKTYTLNKRRFIQDVPVTFSNVDEEEVKAFENNGYFHVTRLKSKPALKKQFEEDEETEESHSSKGKKLLKKNKH